MPVRKNKQQRVKVLSDKQRKRVQRSVWFKKIKVKIKGNAIRELPVDKSEQESRDDSTRVVNVRDNSERAFYKELVKVIELSDVIVEVLDARDPLGTRCTGMERMVMQAGPNKNLVLLLNKIDLVPRESTEKWLKYLREEFPAVPFKCSTQEQRSNLGCKSYKASKPSNILQTSDCLGADTLIQLLKNYSRSQKLKKQILLTRKIKRMKKVCVVQED